MRDQSCLARLGTLSPGMCTGSREHAGAEGVWQLLQPTGPLASMLWSYTVCAVQVRQSAGLPSRRLGARGRVQKKHARHPGGNDGLFVPYLNSKGKEKEGKGEWLLEGCLFAGSPWACSWVPGMEGKIYFFQICPNLGGRWRARLGLSRGERVGREAMQLRTRGLPVSPWDFSEDTACKCKSTPSNEHKYLGSGSHFFLSPGVSCQRPLDGPFPSPPIPREGEGRRGEQMGRAPGLSVLCFDSGFCHVWVTFAKAWEPSRWHWGCLFLEVAAVPLSQNRGRTKSNKSNPCFFKIS